uniref:FYVE-type domain-containing protein n=1 Tax=Trichobilharzia regenti TaxID=157069 RepID=A0AA85IXX5_TRIRE|nr:unnamed protein product [Trichobilharzia regenti]
MKNDVLVDFYLSTIKTQMCELQLVGLKEDDPHYAVVMQAIESVRRELGSMTSRLLSAALPTNTRHKRLFRTKYVEDVDLRNIENCLVSAANKVVNFNFGQSNIECDLRPAQASATEFLDTHSRVQAMVISTMEACLTSLTSNDTEDNSTVNQRNNIQGGGGGDDSDTVDNDSISASNGHRLNSSRLSHIASTASSNDSLKQSNSKVSTVNNNNKNINNKIIHTSVQVNIASVMYTTPVKLPSPELLTISPDLFHILLELDYCSARFEFEFVKCVSRRVRTLQEADDVQMVAVLFSETLMWGLTVKLLTVQQLADRDPCVLLALPRLSILVGCRLLPDSPIGANRLAVGQRLPFMFSSSRSELAYLCRQLYALRPDQLCRLARWLGPNGLPNLIYDQKISTKLSSHIEQEEEKEEAAAANLNTTTSNTKETVGNVNNTTHGSQQTLSSLSPPPPPLTSGSLPRNFLGTFYQKTHVWKTYLPGLHRLYKCISSVADQFAREYPTELRFILQKVIEMHDTSSEVDAESSNSNNENPNGEEEDDEIRRQVEDDDNSSNKGESGGDVDDGETELEEEIEFNPFHMITMNERKIQDLANLFNWNKVMQFNKTTTSCQQKDHHNHPHQHNKQQHQQEGQQANLNQLFKEYSLHFRKYANSSIVDKCMNSMESSSRCSAKSSDCWLQKCTTTTTSAAAAAGTPRHDDTSISALRNNSISSSIEDSVILVADEIGLDVAACLNHDDSDFERLTELGDNSKLKPTSPVKNNKNNSNDNTHNQSSTFTQRLQLLNLGSPIEGIQNLNDSLLFNYLPTWQPDSPTSSSSYRAVFGNRSKLETDEDNNSVQFTDDDIIDDGTDDTDDYQFDYVVGRQCATCNRSFTLIWRRHHCRRCGHIFCSKCCNHWQPIEGLASDKPVRICHECYEFLNPNI